MRLVRDLGRRKLRSTLTITGIMIGIMALVVFGSMANKIDALVKGGSTYYQDKVTVSAKGGQMGFGGPIAISVAADIAKLKDVDVVAPYVGLLLTDDTSGVSMGVPPMIDGSLAGADKGRESFKTYVSEGRKLTADDEGKNVVVLGSDLARKDKVKIGDSYKIRGETFTVVGVLEPTLTAPDNAAMVPLAAGQKLFLGSLPPLVSARLQPAEVATGFTVYPKPGADTETIKNEIQTAIPTVSAMTGKDFDQQIGSATSVLNAILIGIGLISLLVGGLSVVNTMAMAVAERTREIGIKRAIGASRWRIRREIVLESAAIGLIAGLIGLGIGALMTILFNDLGRPSGNVLFELTFGTAFTAVAFATGLGAVAGFIPAWHASRLDPVTALRYE